MGRKVEELLKRSDGYARSEFGIVPSNRFGALTTGNEKNWRSEPERRRVVGLQKFLARDRRQMDGCLII